MRGEFAHFSMRAALFPATLLFIVVTEESEGESSETETNCY